ncbi:MAG: ATP-binding cassette domain-containing protein, partial [Proteobacteria bacterium]|nr:ATP-binding cassette domain-containing protein [Pseudomonadota bacterium]
MLEPNLVTRMWFEAHHHLVGQGGPLATVVASNGLIVRQPAPDRFHALVDAIVGQQISTKAAGAIRTRIGVELGPGPLIDTLVTVDDSALRSCGLSGAKVRSIRDLVRRVRDGSIAMAGVDVRANVTLAMRHVGFVFQNPDHQIVFPTVLEEMTFGFRTRGCSKVESEMRAVACLERYGCGDWVRASVEELSEGQRQKLCILAVIALEPSIIALDEPFASLDLPTRLELNALLVSLPQRVIVASHDLDLLRRFGRLTALVHG